MTAADGDETLNRVDGAVREMKMKRSLHAIPRVGLRGRRVRGIRRFHRRRIDTSARRGDSNVALCAAPAVFACPAPAALVRLGHLRRFSDPGFFGAIVYWRHDAEFAMRASVRRIILSAVVSTCGSWASSLDAGVVHLSGQIPGNPVLPAFDVFAGLTNPLVPTDSGSLDLIDNALPALNLTVQNHVLFDFGMIGPGGLPVTFSPQPNVPSDFSLRLHTLAVFGTGASDFFNVYFNAYYTVNGAQSEPFSGGFPTNSVIPGNPVFPSGSFELDFAATQDPPFTIEISVFDPDGNRATFTDVTVPEPSTFVMSSILLGVVGVVGLRKPKTGVHPLLFASSPFGCRLAEPFEMVAPFAALPAASPGDPTESQSDNYLGSMSITRQVGSCSPAQPK